MRAFKFRAWTEAEKKYIRDCSPFLIGDSEVVVEQYTGIKDKNDKEIYEGDIVDVSGVFVKPKKMVVEFSEEACGFEPFVNGCSDCYFPAGKDVEVIGNIHENPELCRDKEENEKE